MIGNIIDFRAKFSQDILFDHNSINIPGYPRISVGAKKNLVRLLLVLFCTVLIESKKVTETK